MQRHDSYTKLQNIKSFYPGIFMKQFCDVAELFKIHGHYYVLEKKSTIAQICETENK